jgi:hypothetical protein
MAGLNHQACGVLDLASAVRWPDRALLSKHSNQNEKPDLGQESDAHDRDRKEHVARLVTFPSEAQLTGSHPVSA